LVLMLETIGNRQAKNGLFERPHIRLLVFGTLIATFLFLFLDLYQSTTLARRPFNFLSNIASLFMLLNTAIAMAIETNGKAKQQTAEVYFLLLASLALSIAAVCTSFLVLKMAATVGWLAAMTALVVRSTEGGKKAEIGLKMSFVIIMIAVQFIFAIFLLSVSNYSLDLQNLSLQAHKNISVALIGLMMMVLVGLALAGVPPFHFGHVDCADGGNISLAFLFLSNSALQGGALLVNVRNILLKSGMAVADEVHLIGVMLIFGFIVLYLRALDQSRLRRTAAYIATSVGPLFAMSMLFGASVLLPKLVFLLAIFSFLTLTLFTLYGSLIYMDPINLPWATWEDMSGFGRVKPLPTLTFLIALASIAGLPGTIGYFIKLSLIAPLNKNILMSGSVFLSIAIGAAFVMRVFVFMFSKLPQKSLRESASPRPHISLIAASIILIVLGFFPFVH